MQKIIYLFISTNRILTICWGILYLCTPIWTFFLMQTDFSKLISLVNSVFPALLGIFTWWFQKWYPARKAAGKIKNSGIHPLFFIFMRLLYFHYNFRVANQSSFYLHLKPIHFHSCHKVLKDCLVYCLFSK